MDTIENLKSERRKLVDNLTDASGLTAIKAIDKQITTLEREYLLKQINGKQQRLREMALQAWECEQPDNDITCNDGSFHSVKIKKYPKLAALQYGHATFEDNRLTIIRINGEKFRMFNVKYEYNKPNEYTRPSTFAEFLELNSIMQKDMTIQQFNELIEKNNAINAQYEDAIKVFNAQQKELDMYNLSAWGLFSQQNAGHTYKYINNK